MGCCTGRCFLITICFLQLIATVERQVFDFLGYMWAPIIGNFLQIIFIIIGLFGAFQYRPRFLIVYTVWCLVWLGWNVFIICLYLEVGILTRDSPILNIGTGNKSWWLDHGIGCTVVDILNQSTPSSVSQTATRYIPPEEAVQGCLLRYYYVEIIHAGVQCLLTLFGFTSACYVIHVFTEEDDSSAAAQVNDEIEFIKMRYKAPSKKINRSKVYETTSFPTETMTTMTGTPEPPPRQPMERNTVQGERRSHRNSKRTPKKSTSTPVKPPTKAPSKLSVWSKGSSTPNENNHRAANEPRKNLPWVHIAPSPHRGATEINTSLDSESSPPAYDSHEEYHPRQNGSVQNSNQAQPTNAFGFNTDRTHEQPPEEPVRRPPVEPPRPVTYKPPPQPVVPPAAYTAQQASVEPTRPYSPPAEPPRPHGHNVRAGSTGRSRTKERPSLSNSAHRRLDYPDGDRLPSYHSDRQSNFSEGPKPYTERIPAYPDQRQYDKYTAREPPLPPPPSDLDNSYDTDLSSDKNSTRPSANYYGGYNAPPRESNSRGDGGYNAPPGVRGPVANNPLYSEANRHARYNPPAAPGGHANNRYNPPPPSGSNRNNRYKPQDSQTSEESVHSGNVYFRGAGASHV